jgi:membrane protease YdiL (CAAX protease family)
MKKHLKMIGFVSLYMGVYLIIATLCARLYFMTWGDVVFLGIKLKDNVPLFHLFQDVPIFAAFLLISFLIKRENLFKACNFSKVKLQSVGIIFVLCLAVSFFTASFIKMPWVETGMPKISLLLGGRLLAQPWYQFIIWMPLHCAFFREVLFRGILFNEFKKALPLPIAVIMQGLMQGFLFFQFMELDLVFYGFLGAVIFALVYQWCKSLWASILAQIFLESLLLLWNNVGTYIFTKTSSPLILGFSMIVIIAALVYLREYEQSKAMTEQASSQV